MGIDAHAILAKKLTALASPHVLSSLIIRNFDLINRLKETCPMMQQSQVRG